MKKDTVELVEICNICRCVKRGCFYEGLVPRIQIYECGCRFLPFSNCNTKKRPTLGLKPKYIHDEQRKTEIEDAIKRFLDDGKSVPKEWIEEYNNYCL